MSGTSGDPGLAHRFLRGLDAFMQGWRFPVLTLSALGTFAALLLLLIAVPSSAGAMGSFAEEFRQWCFGWDPATGRMEWGYVLMALLSPVTLGVMIAFLWQEPLRAARRSSGTGRLGGPLATALLGAGLVVASCGGLVAFGGAESGELPFPDRDLRTSLPLPGFRLVDQAGEPFSPGDAEGRVMLLTAIYSRCSGTCPMLLGGAREALAALSPEEREDVVLAAITLDPEHDPPETLARLAEAHALRRPGARLLSGPSADVERVLDALGITRTKDPETGLIDHASVFLLVDREGRLAYRLALSERRRNWLVAGLRALLAEPSGTT